MPTIFANGGFPMQTIGLWTGLATFLIIALFHPLVVLAEEKFSNKIWVAFLAAGILFLVLSLRTAAPLLSAVLGVLGFTCLWSIKELSDLSSHGNRARAARHNPPRSR